MGRHRIAPADRGQRAALVFLVTLVPAAAALGNGPSVGFGAGGIVPLANEDVQLVSEFVTVPIEGGRVRCQYDLRNLGDEPRTFTVGFVTNAPWRRDGDASAGGFRSADLEVKQEQKPVPVRYEAVDKDRWAPFLGVPPDSLPVWEVTIGAHATTHLFIAYDGVPDTGCDGSHCSLSAVYHAKTASLWAGTLEHASIRFEFSSLTAKLLDCGGDAESCLSIRVAPEGALRTAGGYVWDLSNWEPDTDFSVRVDWQD